MNINKMIRICLLAANLFCFSALVQSATYDVFQDQGKEGSYGSQYGGQPFDLGLESDILGSEGSKYNETYLLIKEKKLKKAKIKLKKLLEESPRDPKLLILQGMINTLEKKSDEAIQSYKTAIEYEQTYALPYAGLAKLYLESGNYENAERYSNKVLELNKKYIPSYLVLADIAAIKGDSIRVDHYLRLAYQNSYGNKKLQIYLASKLGKLYLTQNNPKKKLELAKELVNIYPGDISAKAILVGALVDNDRGELAEQVLGEIVHNDQQNIKYRLLLANLMMERSAKPEKVVVILDEIIKIKPDSTFFLDIKGTYLRKQKQYDKALDVAREARTKFPDSALGYRLEADILKTQNKLEKAVATYSKAFEVKASEKLLFTICDLYIDLNQSSQAIRLLNRHLNNKGGGNLSNQSIQFKLALIYQQQGNVPLAIEFYEKILKMQPDNLPALNNLAWLYAQQNNPQALVIVEKAYNLAPKSAMIVDTYAYVLTKQGQTNEVVVMMQKAVELNPDSIQLQFHLAEAYAANNNEVEAIEILEKLIASEKDFSDKKAATKLLNVLKTR